MLLEIKELESKKSTATKVQVNRINLKIDSLLNRLEKY